MIFIQIILDCYGVILESVSVKTVTFHSIFSRSHKHADGIVQFYIDTDDISRFAKYHHIDTNKLKEDLQKENFAVLSSTFSDILDDVIARAPFISSPLAFLKITSEQYLRYIVSIIQEGNLMLIDRKIDNDGFFKGIFGVSERNKDPITQIMSTNHVDPESVLFVGDTTNEWVATRLCGIWFIGRNKPNDLNQFRDLPEREKKNTNLLNRKRYLETLPC